MKSLPRTALCIATLSLIGCSSQDFEKEFDCNGTKIKFNDYERFFEIGGVELSAKKDFFMNQITIFGKLNENTIDETLVTFNKINNTLELKDSSRILYEDCIEIDDKKID